MRILLLGGTAWLGRTIAETAIASGHEVTCVARGTQVAAGARLVRADRDDHDGLAGVSGARWDAVVDVATAPGRVRRAVRDLAAHTDRWVFISSCNAYAELAADGIDEHAPLHAPLVSDEMASPEEYGPAKVAGEQAVLEGVGAERAIVLRPGLIGGPGDPTGRSSYWPLRMARPSNPEGRVLVPHAPGAPTAVIDVRDLAAWTVRLLEHDRSGIFNAAGASIPLAQHLEAARAAAGHRGPVVAVSSQWLIAHEVAQWMGPRSLPLWIEEPSMRGLGSLSHTRARAAGLELRPLARTLSDTLTWAERSGAPTVTGAGLTDAEEQALLNALDRP